MSGSCFYQWDFGAEKFSGLSRNVHQNSKSVRARILKCDHSNLRKLLIAININR